VKALARDGRAPSGARRVRDGAAVDSESEDVLPIARTDEIRSY
jgi:hypothetical protein